MVKYFNIGDDRIAVIPLAPREEFHPLPMEEVKAFVAKRWGLDQAKKFSWEQIARGTLKAYETC